MACATIVTALSQDSSSSALLRFWIPNASSASLGAPPSRNTLAQDWRGWLEAGWLDLAMPMVYTLDDRLLRYQMESFAGWPLAARIWPGVGVWLFGGSPEGARMQLAILRRGRFAGEMLFSDDAIASSPELLAALVETPEGVTPPAPSTPSPSTPAP